MSAPSLDIILLSGRLHTMLPGSDQTICEAHVFEVHSPSVLLMDSFPWCAQCREAYHHRPLVVEV